MEDILAFIGAEVINNNILQMSKLKARMKKFIFKLPALI